MQLEEELRAAISWQVTSRSILNDPTFKSSRKKRISVAFQHACLEHGSAIVLLVKTELSGSAAALLRVQTEAFVRGAWIFHCASDAQVTRFAEGSDPPEFGAMVNALEGQNFYAGSLAKFKQKAWTLFNGFTHGGYPQVGARLGGSEVHLQFTERAQVSFLKTSCTLSLLAANEMALICDDEPMAAKLWHAYKESRKSA
jgi:hypothetical protein